MKYQKSNLLLPFTPTRISLKCTSRECRDSSDKMQVGSPTGCSTLPAAFCVAELTRKFPLRRIVAPSAF